jgi:hypothetical protein
LGGFAVKALILVMTLLVLTTAAGCARHKPTETALSPEEAEAPAVAGVSFMEVPCDPARQKQVRDRHMEQVLSYNPIDMEADASHETYLAWIAHGNLPAWVRDIFFEKGLHRQYCFSFRAIRPPYLRGDFNGDKIPDIAVILNRKGNDNPLPAIFHGESRQMFLLDDENGPADDTWMIDSPGKFGNAGEDIIMGKAQSSAVVIFWDGQRYQSEWISD